MESGLFATGRWKKSSRRSGVGTHPPLMELRELNLIAFGPFTDRTLRFDQTPGALHLIYGPNEAGKSSSLRALKALLFGIPARTSDDFLHPYGELRIGGCLRDSRGRELCFVRRKGNRKTLLTPEDEPLGDSVLNPYLGGITPELFGSLFAIDHEELVRGGREILAQKGEVGQALFSASLGSPVVHDLLEQLDKEADALFRPRGSTRIINHALAEYQQLNRALREAALSSRQWETHHRTLEQTRLQLQKLQSELMETRTEITRLERIRRVVPKRVRRRELLQRLEGLAGTVTLPPDFGERRRTAVTEREQARVLEQQSRSRLGELQRQLAELDVQEAILVQAEAIDQLHQRLESYRKALQEHPACQAQRQQLLIDAESLLREVRPDLSLDGLEPLRPVLAQRTRITTLGSERQALQAELNQAEEASRQLALRLEQTRSTLEQLPAAKPVDALRRAVAAARKAGDIDTNVDAHRHEITQLERTCQTDRKRLGLPAGELAGITALPVPARETVEQFQQQFEARDRQEQQLREREAQLTESRRELQIQLDEIQRTGAPPTEHELIEARSRRDALWQRLRGQWLEGEPEKDLPDSYESLVTETDELADRLRREAERVHKQANLQARIEAQQQQLDALRQQREELDREREAALKAWQAQWQPSAVTPRSPKEMRAWQDSLEKLQNDIQRLQQQRDKLEQTVAVRDGHLRAVTEQMPLPIDPATSLEEVLQRAEQQIKQIEELQRQRQQLEREIATLQQELEQADSRQRRISAELERWRTAWHTAVQTIGLDAEALPAEATEMVEKIRTVFDKQREAEKLAARLRHLEQERDSFSREVQEIVRQVAPQWNDLPVEQAVPKLAGLLRETQSRQTLQRQIEQQIQQLQQEMESAQQTADAMATRLRALLDEARCRPTGTEREQQEQLEQVEQRSTEYQQLSAQLDTLEREMTDTEGMTIAELEQEAEGIDADTIPGRIRMLEQKTAEQLEPKRHELMEKKISEEKNLEQMDGSDEATLLAEQLQSLLAQIRRDAGHYTRLRLAAHILREQIEHYREQNQGPLIQRASEHFAALTQGSFQALRTHFFDRDEPELVGIRNDKKIVRVAGMSSGTRDQLYLALRLAALEKQIDEAEPMPFIVDDILIHFDDQRTAATLTLLAELAQNTQVILFTHHRRVVEQAQKLKKGKVAVHEL